STATPGWWYLHPSGTRSLPPWPRRSRRATRGYVSRQTTAVSSILPTACRRGSDGKRSRSASSRRIPSRGCVPSIGHESSPPRLPRCAALIGSRCPTSDRASKMRGRDALRGVVPCDITRVLVTKSYASREVVSDEVSCKLDRSQRFLSCLPDAERGDASVVELADFVTHEAGLGLEDRQEPSPGDLDDLGGRARRPVVQGNSKMAHSVASLSRWRCAVASLAPSRHEPRGPRPPSRPALHGRRSRTPPLRGPNSGSTITCCRVEGKDRCSQRCERAVSGAFNGSCVRASRRNRRRRRAAPCRRRRATRQLHARQRVP